MTDHQYRVFAYTDGLNLYHATINLGETVLLRCDVRRLTEMFLQKNDVLETVNYYSAMPRHLSAKTQQAFTRYTDSLNARDVNVIRGQFKKTNNLIPLASLLPAHNELLPEEYKLPSRFNWIRHEEKETDANIAIDMVYDACLNKYDKAILISGDSDLLPAIRRVLSAFPEKSVLLLSPPIVRRDRRMTEAEKLKTDERYKKLNFARIQRSHLAACVIEE